MAESRAIVDPYAPALTAPMPRFLQNVVSTLGLARPGPEASAGALVVAPAAAGVGLPPPESPFWQRPDVAEKVLLAVAAVESERASLARQANESLNAERALAKEVADLKARARARASAAQPAARRAARTRARRLLCRGEQP
jgi:hypothetical protein